MTAAAPPPAPGAAAPPAAGSAPPAELRAPAGRARIVLTRLASARGAVAGAVIVLLLVALAFLTPLVLHLDYATPDYGALRRPPPPRTGSAPTGSGRTSSRRPSGASRSPWSSASWSRSSPPAWPHWWAPAPATSAAGRTGP
ncbi:hypothetical protein GCM10025734_33650 [Kitasatospora paranensis]